MMRWFKANPLKALGVAVAGILLGAVMAFKAENKLGYLLIAGGAVLLVWVAKATGLI